MEHRVASLFWDTIAFNLIGAFTIMETFWEIKPGLVKQSTVALGFFDGVHLGHQAVITKALADAKKWNIPSIVATFREHPRQVISGQPIELLTSLEQRLDVFSKLGVNVTLALSFTKKLSQLSASQYIKEVLLEGLGARSISIGYNHHFGSGREGNPELLKQLSQDLDFQVNVIEPVLIGGIEVSSSYIRKAITNGDPVTAQLLLGRPYALASKVVKGDGRGKEIGFPTANLELSSFQLMPGIGVYAGWIRLENDERKKAVINCGYRPTVSSSRQLTIEAHILEPCPDLYGQLLTVEFHQYLRPEKTFANLEVLKEQISKDCASARQALSSLPIDTRQHA